MSRIFHKIFPLFDYVYILQLMEYEPLRFLKWFIAYPFARNLQRKNRLRLTQKTLLIIFVSLLEIVIFSFLVTLIFSKILNLLVFIISFILLQLISPFFILVSLLSILPIQKYFENRLVAKAKIKLSKIPNIKVIAIAGSYGKTSTKNILYTLLWRDYKVIKTPKSFNTLVSIARTILDDIKSNTQVFIVEMDSYKEGDLTKLVQVVNPQISVITAIGPQHLERFGNMEKLAKAQLELASQIKNGTVFLNSSDYWSMRLLKNQKIKSKVLLYGMNASDIYYASLIKQLENGIVFNFHHNDEKIKIKLLLFGEQHVINFLSAASVANLLGLSLKKIQQRASLIFPTEHRLEIKKVNGVTLIDNTYNTNPSVSEVSLKLLKEYKGDRRILVTPGYVELGKESKNENIKFMEKASKIADEIILVGENSRAILLKGLEKVRFPKQKIHIAKDTKSAFDILFSIAKEEDLVLLENDLPDQYF